MFVVFEGIDGGGKSTISGRVADALREQGIPVTELRSDGVYASQVAGNIRELARDSRNIDLTPQAEFFLYVARDVQQIEESIRPALGRGDIVFADRFLYTAEAMARFGRHLSVDYVRPILTAAADGLNPDLVVLVDVDPSLARLRRKAAKVDQEVIKAPGRKGMTGVGLQHRLRAGYLQLAKQDPQRWAVVDNDASLQTSINRVTNLILDVMKRGALVALAEFGRSRVAPQSIGSVEQALEAFLTWLDRHQSEPKVIARILSGFYGPKVDALRLKLSEQVPKNVLSALKAQTDEVSWQIRERLLESMPGQVARSLTGLRDDERAALLRSKLAGSVPADVLRSLRGDDSDLAWELRERLWTEQCLEVMASTAGMHDERAQALREKWLSEHWQTLPTEAPLAVAACKSITTLDDERAWELRNYCRESVPAAALSSLKGVFDEPSWQWRSDFLRSATKIVMSTLLYSDDERGWDLRDEVVEDCKEAMDGIRGNDHPRAWTLRDTQLDRWPSTVVKSLAQLANTDRGQVMVNRQLQHHSGSISLLRHAAVIALGLNKPPKRDLLEG